MHANHTPSLAMRSRALRMLAAAAVCAMLMLSAGPALAATDDDIQCTYTGTYTGDAPGNTLDILAATSANLGETPVPYLAAANPGAVTPAATDLTDAADFKLTSLNLAGTEYIDSDGTYTGGSNVDVKPGASVSYEFSWGPLPSGVVPQAGDYIEKEIFGLKGLSLASQSNRPMNIGVNGRVIRIGTWSLTYNSTTGAFTYRVVFNANAKTFKNIEGSSKGSGKFGSSAGSNSLSVLGTNVGTATVIEVVTPVNPTPTTATGVGWSAPRVPTFSTTTYGLGKALKWGGTDSSPGTTHNALEWRAGYMTLLEEVSNQFFEDNTTVDADGAIKLTEAAAAGTYDRSAIATPTTDNYIIEDTLDVNQSFAVYKHGDSKYTEGTPFFFELPIMYSGTGTLENGTIRTGYTGPGDISERFAGGNFTYRANGTTYATAAAAATELGASGYYGTDTDVDYVKSTPLTWTIVKVRNDLGQMCEKVVINIGKLGTGDSSAGITFGTSSTQVSSNRTYFQTRLTNLIANAQATITRFENGTVSPLTNLDTRADELAGRINQYVSDGTIPADAAQPLLDKLAAVRAWYATLDASGRNADLAAVPTQVTEANEVLATLVTSYPTVKSAQQYANWDKASNNILADQHTYVSNYDNYLRDWNNTLVRYQLTQQFYASDTSLGANAPVWGFVMRYRADAINSTVGTYANSMTISSNGTSQTTDATGTATFNHVVAGTFQSGAVVLQKKDAATGETLAGALYNVTHGTTADSPLDHFAGTQYSPSGTEYIWDSTGDDYTNSMVGSADAITDLPTDSKGVLAVAGFFSSNVKHAFVEKAAPAGYYLDTTPIEFTVDTRSVVYVNATNDVRAVKLTKASTYSATGATKMVDGTVFALYKADGTPVEGFTKKTYTNEATGVTTEYYLKSDGGTAELTTCAGGQLNIHGLDAGEYYLVEKTAAPGYVLDDTTHYTFTLAETATSSDLADTSTYYTENGFHYVLPSAVTVEENGTTRISPDPVLNDEQVGSVTMTKVDSASSSTELTGAAFALLRWTGTEQQWADNPENTDLWKAAPVNAGGTYFTCDAQSMDTTFDGATYTGFFVSEDAATLGQLTFENLPSGHYSLREVKAPATYTRNAAPIYFDVDATSGQATQLSWNANGQNPIADNRVPNTLNPGSLQVYKVVESSRADDLDATKTTWDFSAALSTVDATGAYAPLTGAYHYEIVTSDATGDHVTAHGEATLDAAGSFSFKLGHNQSMTMVDLPAGTRYIVTEASADGFSTTWPSGYEGQIAAESVSTVTARNRYMTGMLQLSKNVLGAYGDRNRAFEFSITGVDAAGNPLTGSFPYEGTANEGATAPAAGVLTFENGVASIVVDGVKTTTIPLSADQSISVPRLPAGSKLTISETPVDGYTTKISTGDSQAGGTGTGAAATIEGTQVTVTIDDDKRKDVDFSNIHNPELGDLMITKSVESLNIDPTKQYSFTIEATYTVGEGATATTVPVTGTFDIETGTTGETSNATAGQIDFGTSGTASFTLAHRGYLAIKGLPEGTTYTVTETVEPGYDVTTDSTGGSASNVVTGTIDAKNPATAAFTNIHREGNLIVSKEVEGRGASTTQAFAFTAKLYDADGNPYTGSIPYESNGEIDGSADGSTGTPSTGKLQFTDGEATFSLTAAQSIVMCGIPEGFSYEVTEAAAAGYATTSTDATGTIAHKVESNVRFVNRLETGELQLMKTVTGTAGELPDSEIGREFTFTVKLTGTSASGIAAESITGTYGDMTFENGVATLKLADGGSAHAADLPAGLHYEVSEEELEDYTTVASGETGDVADATISRVEFSNLYDPTPSPVTVELGAHKTLSGAELTDGQFTFELVDAKTGDVVNTAKNDSAGAVSFGELSFDTVGTYRYQVREQLGSETGVTYDAAIHEIVVNVTRDGYALTYEVLVDGVAGGEMPTFANTYEEPVTPSNPTDLGAGDKTPGKGDLPTTGDILAQTGPVLVGVAVVGAALVAVAVVRMRRK